MGSLKVALVKLIKCSLTDLLEKNVNLIFIGCCKLVMFIRDYYLQSRDNILSLYRHTRFVCEGLI